MKYDELKFHVLFMMLLVIPSEEVIIIMIFAIIGRSVQ
jgi:hypothetical protein